MPRHAPRPARPATRPRAATRVLAALLACLLLPVGLSPADTARADCEMAMAQAQPTPAAEHVARSGVEGEASGPDEVDSSTPASQGATDLMETTCLRGGSSGGGGGGGGGTTPSTKRWFTLNGRHVGDERNPLARFTAWPVASLDVDNDGVVQLPHLPHAGLAASEYLGGAVNLSNENLVQLVSLFRLTKDQVAQEIHDILSIDRRLHATRDQAVGLINNLQYADAANLILNRTTPAEVLVWCGSETHPLYVRWVLSIPAVFACNADASKNVAMVARIEDFEAIASGVADQNDPTGSAPTKRVKDIRVLFSVASQQQDSTRYLTGFTYANASVGASTRIDHAWTIDATLTSLVARAPVGYAARFLTGLPGDPLAVGSFSSGDKVRFGNGTILTRGHAYWARLDEGITSFNTSFEFSASEGRGTGLQLFRNNPTVVKSDLKGFVLEPAPGFTVVGEAAFLRDELKVKVTKEPRAIRLLVQPGKANQRPDVPNDTVEVKATLHDLQGADTTVQTVGLPTEGLYRFAIPTADRAGAGGAMVNPKASTSGWFRTILITHDHGDRVFSATGDYTRRAVLWVGDGGDPIGLGPGPYRFFGAYFPLAELAWPTYHSNVSVEGSHVGMVGAASTDGDSLPGAIWGFFSPDHEAADWTGAGFPDRVPDDAYTPRTYASPLAGFREADCVHNVQTKCVGA